MKCWLCGTLTTLRPGAYPGSPSTIAVHHPSATARATCYASTHPIPEVFAHPPATPQAAEDRATFMRSVARSSRSAAWQRARARALKG